MFKMLGNLTKAVVGVHYLANLKYRQTTTYGPALEGFAYAEVPHWQLLQWRDATLAERTKTDDR